jgi:hypothetical protein
MNKTEQELREWCEGVEADNDTLRREILRLSNERDEFKQLAKDSMRLAEHCASKCEELKEKLEHVTKVAKHRLHILSERTVALGAIDSKLALFLSNEYPHDPDMFVWITEAN